MNMPKNQKQNEEGWLALVPTCNIKPPEHELMLTIMYNVYAATECWAH